MGLPGGTDGKQTITHQPQPPTTTPLRKRCWLIQGYNSPGQLSEVVGSEETAFHLVRGNVTVQFDVYCSGFDTVITHRPLHVSLHTHMLSPSCTNVLIRTAIRLDPEEIGRVNDFILNLVIQVSRLVENLPNFKNP